MIVRNGSQEWTGTVSVDAADGELGGRCRLQSKMRLWRNRKSGTMKGDGARKRRPLELGLFGMLPSRG